MKLAYGYMRIEYLNDEEIQQLECGLRKLTEAEGFFLIEICYEYQPGYYGTFYRLTEELMRAQVQHVVVPSLDHLATHPLLRDQLIMHLEKANPQVWTIER